MKLKLSKSIAEFESEDVATIWEAPDIYSDVHSNDVWLIYGRKGAGKSTVVDYLGTENHGSNVIKVRPGQTDLFSKLYSTIAKSPKQLDERVIEQSVVTTLDFAFLILVIEQVAEIKGFLPPGSAREMLYNFVTSNKVGGGSALKKTVKFLSFVGGRAVKTITDLESALEKVGDEITVDDAKQALTEYLIASGKGFVLCIDDIDEIGFSYSRVDRIFVNSLLTFMVKWNKYFVERRTKGRVLLTAPSELYFQSTLWGNDWVSSRSRCLTWSIPQTLHALVNKRIAIELNVRKKSPRKEGDKFSIDTEHTWKRVLPMTILNKRGKLEGAFEYLLRHTFYTPRHLLGLCESVILNADELIERTDVAQDHLQPLWSRIFQEAVTEFSHRAEHDAKTIYSAIYENYEEVLKAFVSRPNIWNRAQLLEFVASRKLSLVRKHDKRRTFGEDLIYELQQIGFLGLGTRNFDPSPPGGESYLMQFSFLEDYPTRKAWEVAAITPLYYDSYDIRSVDGAIVRPHDRLVVSAKVLRLLRTYDAATNGFATDA
jgi:hypothetical protein